MTSPQMKRVAEIAQAQGYIYLRQVQSIYDTPGGARSCLQSLCRKRVLNISKLPERFDFIKPLKTYKPRDGVDHKKRAFFMSSKQYKKHITEVRKCRSLGEFI
jgi:hypothetical protein